MLILISPPRLLEFSVALKLGGHVVTLDTSSQPSLLVMMTSVDQIRVQQFIEGHILSISVLNPLSGTQVHLQYSLTLAILWGTEK